MLTVHGQGDVLGFVSWNKRQNGPGLVLLDHGNRHCSRSSRPGLRHRGATRARPLPVPAHAANRVEASTEIGNLAEQRALEKAGFTREGVLRGCAFQGGRWHDGVLYSMLRAEVES